MMRRLFIACGLIGLAGAVVLTQSTRLVEPPSTTSFDTARPITLKGRWAGSPTYTGARGPQVYFVLDTEDAAGRSERRAGEVARAISFEPAEVLSVTGFLPSTGIQPSTLIPFSAVPMLLRLATAGHLIRVTEVVRANGMRLTNVRLP